MAFNDNEPTPNREQRVLAHYAEVRRRKTVGQWHSLVTLAEWQMRLSLSTPLECAAIKCHSGLKARMPLNAIFIGANLATDALVQKELTRTILLQKLQEGSSTNLRLLDKTHMS